MTDVPACPMEVANRVFGGKWKPSILFRLADRTYRFRELKREMPWTSERVLIRQLKELVADGIVAREDHREVPPRVEYSLTERGESLTPLLRSMAQWGAEHLSGSGGAGLVAAESERPADLRSASPGANRAV